MSDPADPGEIWIKRYPNRKLYNTLTCQYVTLEKLAETIRSGINIFVTDHASGQDLTSIVLTEIIFNESKRKGGFLPGSFLTRMIREQESRLAAFLSEIPASHLEQALVSYFNQLGFPSAEDIQILNERIAQLEQKITRLQSKISQGDSENQM